MGAALPSAVVLALAASALAEPAADVAAGSSASDAGAGGLGTAPLLFIAVNTGIARAYQRLDVRSSWWQHPLLRDGAVTSRFVVGSPRPAAGGAEAWDARLLRKEGSLRRLRAAARRRQLRAAGLQDHGLAPLVRARAPRALLDEGRRRHVAGLSAVGARAAARDGQVRVHGLDRQMLPCVPSREVQRIEVRVCS
eukprot:SRR837773.8564.p1 GENE.SRR837773.8564~~SRR837773.8564.p1  ORF type:complete len:213 (-),score=35.18 SRR837773.8564:146-730(-)